LFRRRKGHHLSTWLLPSTELRACRRVLVFKQFPVTRSFAITANFVGTVCNIGTAKKYHGRRGQDGTISGGILRGLVPHGPSSGHFFLCRQTNRTARTTCRGKSRRLFAALLPRRQGQFFSSPTSFRSGGFLSELHALKIDLLLRQQGLDTTTPAGKAMFQMMGVFAESSAR